jgi:protein TonB
MEDRVGDVLARRAALDQGTASGIAVSLLLHGAVTAVAMWAALHHPQPQTVNTLTIRMSPMVPANAAAPAPPAAKPVPKTLQPPRPEPEEVKPAAKPQKNTAPPSPFGKSDKKAGPVEKPPAPAPAPATTPGATTTADVPAGGTGVTGIEGGDFPYTLYIENMKRLIGAHWFRPQVSGPVTATVYFVVNRDGTIRDGKIETASGNGAFDRAALRAILESSPLPPLPFAYSGTYIGVHLTFK